MGAHDDIVVDIGGGADTQDIALTGNMGNTDLPHIRRAAAGDILIAIGHLSICHRCAQPRDRLYQLLLSIAAHAGHADDLVLMEVKADILDALSRGGLGCGHMVHPENHAI